MQALILVGGEATRLRPLTCNMPKAMVPVCNRPFLEHVIGYLGKHDVRDVVLAQGHLPQLMVDYFGDGSRFDSKLTHALEAKPMNTAGAVKNAESFLKGRFYVLNGDIFTDLDISEMLKFHIARRASVTIALTAVDNPTAYGLIETDQNGRVKRFLEKPTPEQVTTNMINAGTYILEPHILNDIPAQTNYSFERQLFPKLLARGEPVYAFVSSGYWIDIGTPEKYFQLHSDLLSGTIRGNNLIEGKKIHIDPGAHLEGQVLLGDKCIISRGARISGPVVMGSGTSIAEDSVIQKSIMWQNVRIGPKVAMDNCLIANDCEFEESSSAEKSVLGDHIRISRNTRLGTNSRIWPVSK